MLIMKTKLIAIENFGSKDSYISVKYWEEIVNAINKLDGNNISYCFLYSTEEPSIENFLAIGGGENNLYICSYYDGDEYCLLNKNNRNDKSIIPMLVGQVSGKLKKHCVDREQLLSAVKLFCETWSIYDNPDWEMDII